MRWRQAPEKKTQWSYSQEGLAMANRDTVRTMPNSYFKLVREFPLTHIRDDDQLRAAQEMIDRLLEKDLDSGSEEYLDVR